jgi:predicted nucleic acid-binding protein
MTDFVLDASIALAWCFEDEATTITGRVLERLAGEAASVPAIWHIVDEETYSRAFTRVLDLAREERLTAYDAVYLELAMRLGVPLASKDQDLCDAAERVGVIVLRAA